MPTDPREPPPVTLADIEDRLETDRQRCRELEEQAKQMTAESEQRRQAEAEQAE
jgi:hypothetical protein